MFAAPMPWPYRDAGLAETSRLALQPGSIMLGSILARLHGALFSAGAIRAVQQPLRLPQYRWRWFGFVGAIASCGGGGSWASAIACFGFVATRFVGALGSSVFGFGASGAAGARALQACVPS